ncbi:transglutaminase [Tenacibaculum sp. KUL152]|nr:transglutaminase [Tenacibaculum sp. KUL152]
MKKVLNAFSFSPTHNPMILLCVAYGVLLFTLKSALMLWVLVLGVCACIVRIVALKQPHSLPKVRTVNLLAVLAVFALAWFGLSIGLLDSMINLLVIACALKLMLVEKKRDFHLLICTCLFLIGCGFISALSILAWLGYLGILILLLLATALYHGPNVSVKYSTKFIITLVLQGLPIAFLLFLVLPQLPPLWQMPTSKSSQTGLSESVTPGDIASLAKSSDLAFTATFESASDVPLMATRYWRAMVMEDFDGKTWSISNKRRLAERQLYLMNKPSPLTLMQTQNGENSISYEMIVEPTHQTWLFGLEVSVPNNALNAVEVRELFDHTLKATVPVASKKVFHLRYLPDQPVINSIAGFERNLNLALETTNNPRTQAWAKNLVAKFETPQEVAQAIMQHFANQSFRYTLEPNAMPDDPIDTFLFEEKSGFCAHYAGAMTYALRAAGIPARMVTGYHGGESLSDNVLQVRQYDAHAWVEALVGEQWVRFDPTSMVAPSRLAYGLEQALLDFGEQREKGLLGNLGQAELFTQIQGWLRQLDYTWSKWILGFDANSQSDMLERLLGELSTKKMTAVFLSLIGIIGVILLVYFFPVTLVPSFAPYQRYYVKSLALIEKHTNTKRGNDSPSHYTQKVAAQLNTTANSIINDLHRLYTQLCYQEQADEKETNVKMKQGYKRLKRSLN